MEVIKGRMYDYNNGRFLSVDPFIQAPTSTQSMNPYTYIFNNPLSGIDPTGYECTRPTGDGGCKSARKPKEERKTGQGLSGDWRTVYASNNGSSGNMQAYDDSDFQLGGSDISELNSNQMQANVNPSNHAAKLRELKNSQLQPQASPLPITTVTAQGQTVNLEFGHDRVWHDAGSDEGNFSSDMNRYAIDSYGIAHRIPEKGLVTTTPVADVAAIATGTIFLKKGLQSGGKKLAQKLANQSRDKLSETLSTLSNSRRPATVTAGYNIKTGEVAARSCAGGKCAEDFVVEALGGDKSLIRFTKAKRPRTGEEVPICYICEPKYGRDVFPDGTTFKSDL